MKAIGVIGGSGVYKLEGFNIVAEHEVSTPFGAPSDKIFEADYNGNKFYFLPRHGRNHSYLPHEVNYRANIFALKKLGVEVIVSVSAVGSLKEEHNPTTFVLPDQFIDWTKGKRERTFFGNGIVAHVSTAEPICKELQSRLAKFCDELELKYHKGGSYICIEGPQFSSKAESAIYRSFGADVIGMTNVPESYLAKEAGMSYATVAMVTDYDCWKEEHCTVEEIMKVMHQNNAAAQQLLLKVLPDLYANPINVIKENAGGIMTPKERMTEEQKQWIEVLVR